MTRYEFLGNPRDSNVPTDSNFSFGQLFMCSPIYNSRKISDNTHIRHANDFVYHAICVWHDVSKIFNADKITFLISKFSNVINIMFPAKRT